MKYIQLILLFIFALFYSYGTAQQVDTLIKKIDTLQPAQNKRAAAKDSSKKHDTSIFISSQNKAVLSQKGDSVPTNTILNRNNMSQPELAGSTEVDSTVVTHNEAAIPQINLFERPLAGIKWINTSAKPVAFPIEERRVQGKEIFFYSLCGLLILLGLFKTFYKQYFANLFRVYFNTSLRQSQLSEQLLQARLPSFLLNIFFVLMGGIFIWLLLSQNAGSKIHNSVLLLQFCIAIVAVIYLVKFCFLKFIGWASGIREAADHYIFIIFLVNKLLALLLIPFIILLAFGKPEWFGIIKTFGLLCVGALFLSRYIKSYGLVGQKLSVKPFHFLIFFAGAELIPLLLLYKSAVDYFIR